MHRDNLHKKQLPDSPQIIIKTFGEVEVAGSLTTTLRVYKSQLWCNLDSTSTTKWKDLGRSQAAFLNLDRQEKRLVTAVWRNGGFSASYDSFVEGSSAVLRLNFCAKNPPLPAAAARIFRVVLLKQHNPRTYASKTPFLSGYCNWFCIL